MNRRHLRNLVLGMVVGGVGLAATSVPNSFQAGQVISSTQVNQNFSALASAVDQVAGRFGGGQSGSAGEGPGCLPNGVVGQVFLFAGDYPPEGALPADGQQLQISQHTALFSLLGNRYGGDGRTTFALPDLRDVAPRSAGGTPVSYFVCLSGQYPQR